MSKQKQDTGRRNKKLRTIIIVIAAIIVFDLTVSGFLKFGYYVIKCGKVPVALDPAAPTGRVTYVLPGYYTPGWASTTYICTEQEAIDQGIAKDLLNNPREW